MTSARAQRAGVDNVTWDNRPRHFSDSASNSDAHLFIDSAARGPPRSWSSNHHYPNAGRFEPVDTFTGAAPKALCSAAPPVALNWDSPEFIFVILFIALVVWVASTCVEKRVRREVSLALREAFASRGSLAPAAP